MEVTVLVEMMLRSTVSLPCSGYTVRVTSGAGLGLFRLFLRFSVYREVLRRGVEETNNSILPPQKNQTGRP